MDKKPFQFSTRRVFAVVTLLCVSMGLFCKAVALPTRDLDTNAILGWLSIATFGLAVGTAFRKPFRGMFLVCLVFGIIGFIVAFSLWH
jgi:hypothetical protein